MCPDEFQQHTLTTFTFVRVEQRVELRLHAAALALADAAADSGRPAGPAAARRTLPSVLQTMSAPRWEILILSAALHGSTDHPHVNRDPAAACMPYPDAEGPVVCAGAISKSAKIALALRVDARGRHAAAAVVPTGRRLPAAGRWRQCGRISGRGHSVSAAREALTAPAP